MTNRRMKRTLKCDLCGAEVHEFLIAYCSTCDTQQCDKCMCDCRKQSIEDAMTYDDEDE